MLNLIFSTLHHTFVKSSLRIISLKRGINIDEETARICITVQIDRPSAEYKKVVGKMQIRLKVT
jgi:hypothetical protein